MAKFDFNPFTGKFDKVSNKVTDISDIATTYLKLDCSNDPLTGNLEISKADPEQRLTDTGNSEYTRVTKSDTSNVASRKNRVVIPGGAGSAVGFDGNGYVSLSAGQTLTTPSNWSISFWIKKIASIEDYSAPVFLDFGLGGAVPSGVTIHTQKLQIVWNDDAKKTSNTIMATGNWYHCVVTSENNTTFKVYVNGTDDTAGTGSGSGHAIGGNKFNLTYLSESGTFILDEVALFNKTLSPAEVSTYYNSGSGYYFTGAESGIVNLWHLDEGTGTSISDSIGAFTGNFSGTGNTWETGLVPISTVSGEANVWESKDGLVAGEKGIHTFGDSLGRTVIDGDTINFNIGGSEVASITGNNFTSAGFLKNTSGGVITGGNTITTSEISDFTDNSSLLAITYAIALG